MTRCARTESRTRKNPAISITLAFICCSVAWRLLFSDRMLHLAGVPETVIRLSVLRGWGFIVVTAVFIYCFCRKYFRDLEQARLTREDSERRFSAIFDASPVATAITRAADARVIHVNQATLRMFGFTRTEMIGRTSLELNQWLDLADRQRMLAILQEQGRVQNMESRFRRKSGETGTLIASMELIELDGETYLLSMLADISERKRAEEEARLYARRLVEREEELRKEIAAELHDQIGRDLTLLGINVAIVEGKIDPAARERIGGRIEDSLRLIEGISRTVRDITASLRPPLLDDYGLAAALVWHVETFARRTGIACCPEIDEPEERLSPEHELALFRIAQEALVNVAKHSGARQVEITLVVNGGNVRLMVQDDGRGLSFAATGLRIADGWGVTIMRERAAAIGAMFSMTEPAEGGTVVSVELPEVE